MKEEPPKNDLKSIWKSQPREGRNMSGQQIRERARNVMDRSRFRLALECSMTLVLSVIWGKLAYNARDSFGQVGWSLAALDVLCMFIVRLPALRKAWSATLTPDAATRTCLDFQRRMLQSRMAYERHAFLFAFPLLISIGILVLGPFLRQFRSTAFAPPLRAFLPLFLLLILWGPWFIVIRRRLHRRWHDEIAILDAFENDQT
jgi:hypothetical protein